jgi:C-terminal processing protease CtpA/Prc
MISFALAARRILVVLSLACLIATATWAEESNLLREAMESITAAELDAHASLLADDGMEGREPGTAGGKAASKYLMQQFEARGLTPAGNDARTSYFQEFGSGYRNVLGLWEGSDPELKNQVIIVGAHYDHVGRGSRHNSRGGIGDIHNGADDNASGTSAVLEAVDAIVRVPGRPRRSVLFALWDGEEQGLLGSGHWIEHPTVPANQVTLAINLDMVGRLRDERLTVIGTRSTLGLRQLVSRQNEDLGLNLEFPWAVDARSDHSTFYDFGIPVLMFHTGLHDDYHTPRDDAELLNPVGMQKVTRLLFNVTWELAQRDDRPAFRITSRRETDATRKQLEKASAPLPPRLGVGWNDSEQERARPGLLVTKILPDSAAERAEMLVGDRIVRFNGQEILDEAQFRRVLAVVSNPVTIAVEREGEPDPVELEVVLSGNPVRVGIAWREDPAEPGAVFLVQVIPGSPAELAGLKTGDRIYEISGQTFAGSDELLELVKTLPGPIELLVERDGRLMTVTIDVESPGGVAAADGTCPPLLVHSRPAGISR